MSKQFTLAAVFVGVLAIGCDTTTSPQDDAVSTDNSFTGGLTQAAGLALTNLGPTCVGARSPGFFCRNKDKTGKNPNLPPGEFDLLAIDAAVLLTQLQLTPLDIDAAVCNNRDQLLRHLATLALNLAANLIDESSPLDGEPFPSAGEAFDAAIQIASDPSATKEERNAIKDVLDRINNNVNTVLGDDCLSETGGGEGE